MILNDRATHYEVLDVKPDASPHQIREAYLRAKATYNKDSAALYTLVEPEEREEMILMIDNAYKILSNPQRRREYDQKHGFAVSFAPDEFNPETFRNESLARKIISIDRVPPMEMSNVENDDRMLIPPAVEVAPLPQTAAPSAVSAVPLPQVMPSAVTSLPATHPSGNMAQPQNIAPPATPVSLVSISSSATTGGNGTSPCSVSPVPPATTVPMAAHATLPSAPPSTPFTPPVSLATDSPKANSFDAEIANETAWSGVFLRKIREFNSVSIEEVSNITKINKNYILAIEEENYSKLPAAVYVRGFVTQLAKTYRLPTERVVGTYMTRLISQREKSGK